MATATTLENRWRETSATQDNNTLSINLSQTERTISIAAGVKLALSGFKGLFKSPFSSIIKLGAGGYLLNRGITGHCDLYSRMGRNTTEPVNVNIRSSYLIDKPRQEVYDFWRKLDNLPLFMKHLESVEIIDDKRSHWVLKLPAGVAKVSWDAEIVNDEPGFTIGWSSLPDSLIDNAGKVRFQDSPDGEGTLVDIVISYRPPVGGFGGSIAHVLNPVFKNMVDNDVRNFKQYMDIDGGASSSSVTGSQVNDNDFAEPVTVVIEETITEDDTTIDDNISLDDYSSEDTVPRFQSHIDPVEGKQNPGAQNNPMM